MGPNSFPRGRVLFLARLTVGDDVNPAGGHTGPQHGVLFRGMGDADDGMHICQAELERFVDQDVGHARKAKQGVVGEDHLAGKKKHCYWQAKKDCCYPLRLQQLLATLR